MAPTPPSCTFTLAIPSDSTAPRAACYDLSLPSRGYGYLERTLLRLVSFVWVASCLSVLPSAIIAAPTLTTSGDYLPALGPAEPTGSFSIIGSVLCLNKASLSRDPLLGYTPSPANLRLKPSFAYLIACNFAVECSADL
jgi:hypothetical protein